MIKHNCKDKVKYDVVVHCRCRICNKFVKHDKNGQ